ncbi:type I restriction endonuclease subunit S [Bacillus pseudomycoides]|uniref:Type I restriction endonuclease subunit S n=1 Tax=Bacillus pseudomycoides TaxID=64104 RepID=A0ABD6T1U4_9BACI|nr:restriction endonuclease subunit S [Bacillus pseudomycoides]PHE89897.1 type I restriction endonuclease subunit S [Bacillus pseudomycoides]
MKNKHTPEIRFPGYTGDWEQRKLGEISEKVTEKNKNNIYSETLTNSAEFGIINQRDFFDKDISNEKNLDGYYVVRPDDFVYNPRISNLAPVGPIKRNKLGRTGVMSPLYYVFRTHDVDKTYLEEFFSANGWHKFMKLNGDSGARSDRFAIKDSLFREMPIPIPSMEEQTKIGNFLKQLDDTIALQQQELTALKQTKQGFLQKMFPKEGESVPEVRFPGITGDWEQRKVQWLIDEGIIEEPMDGNHGEKHPTASEYVDYGIPFLMATDIKNGIVDLKNCNFIAIERSKKLNKGFAKNGDVLITHKATIGEVAILSGLSREYAVLTPQVTYYRVIDKSKLAIKYLYAYFNSPDFQSTLKLEATQSTRPYIGITGQHKLDIKFPKAIKEQEKIGEWFSDLDNLITLHQRELDALQETKKAFLQKMFV